MKSEMELLMFELIAKLDELSIELLPEKQALIYECKNICRSVLNINQKPQDISKAEVSEQKAIKLFIVDDDEDTQKLLRFSLKKKGFDVVSEVNPLTALNRISEVNPDLILLDIMMPNMSGFEFLDHLNKLPNRNNFKVAIGSSRSYDHDKQNAFKAGANDFISKPYNLAELVLRLHNILGR